jgi:hypothetical protein
MTVHRRTLEYSDSELLRWYDLIMEARKTSPINKRRNKGISAFCRRKGIDPIKLHWFYFRFVYKEETNPDLHVREIEIAKSWRESGLGKKEFCKLHNYPCSKLSAADMHLTYRDRLDKLLEDRPVVPEKTGLARLTEEIEKKAKTETVKKNHDTLEYEELSFHQVPAITACAPIEPDDNTLIHSKNIIEINAAGLSITLKPGMNGEKLFKIIEFLEGL